jgi:uncharacterized membrane protein YgdD (TMEM256/DUF423 family)
VSGGAHRWFGVIGAALGAAGVAAGAFGAHGLRELLAEQGTTAAWKTAALYQMVHALALILVALVQRGGDSAAVRVAGWAFAAGVVLFSGSLYLLAAASAAWAGPITPLGGAAFIVGWIALAVALKPAR